MNNIYYTSLRAANVARQAEWDASSAITPEFRGNELAGEVGETLDRALGLIALGIAAGRISNVVKKLARERLGLRGSLATKQDLAEEMADLHICADLTAMDFDIDVEKATRDKFNATSEKLSLRTRLISTPPLMLGNEVRLIDEEDCEIMRVVSMCIDPDGQIWCSVAPIDARHRGGGVYDGETTDIKLEHLEIVNGKR